MRRLELVGLSEDGRQLVFADDSGAEFTAPADDRLRVALRGDRTRLGQLEIEMDSALRPREIQAHIRAGESPETVAALAQVAVEKIMPYCVPVLAERQHIAELARRSHVRRKNADGPARTLSEVVTERLRSRGVDLTCLEWDSWRRADGRWTVQTTYLSGERQRSGHFSFDVVGRYSVADDDEAKWLAGERQSTSKGPQPREAGKGGDRRLAAVPAGEDLLNLPDEQADDEQIDDLTAVVRAVSEPSPRMAASEADLPAPEELDRDAEAKSEAEPEPISPEPASVDPAPPGQISAAARQPSQRARPSSSAERVPEPTAQRRRRQRRPSVPSWDEIMFGGAGGAGGTRGAGGAGGAGSAGGTGGTGGNDSED